MPDMNKAEEFGEAFEKAFEKADKVDEGEHIELINSLDKNRTRFQFGTISKASQKKARKAGSLVDRLDTVCTVHDDGSANYISIGIRGDLISYTFNAGDISQILYTYFPFREAYPASMWGPAQARGRRHQLRAAEAKIYLQSISNIRKYLSLGALKGKSKGEIDAIPPQRETKAANSVDPLTALGDVSDMTVEEIADEIGKTERGVKTMLTRRGLVASDYDGAARKEKAAG